MAILFLRRPLTSAESELALGRHYGCKRISKSPVEYGFLRGWANTGSSTFSSDNGGQLRSSCFDGRGIAGCTACHNFPLYFTVKPVKVWVGESWFSLSLPPPTFLRLVVDETVQPCPTLPQLERYIMYRQRIWRSMRCRSRSLSRFCAGVDFGIPRSMASSTTSVCLASHC